MISKHQNEVCCAWSSKTVPQRYVPTTMFISGKDWRPLPSFTKQKQHPSAKTAQDFQNSSPRFIFSNLSLALMGCFLSNGIFVGLWWRVLTAVSLVTPRGQSSNNCLGRGSGILVGISDYFPLQFLKILQFWPHPGLFLTNILWCFAMIPLILTISFQLSCFTFWHEEISSYQVLMSSPSL